MRVHELVGLVSLHVASKAIPNWAWMTSANGVPDPAWYTAADAQGSQMLYSQTDFLWELPFIKQIQDTNGGA